MPWRRWGLHRACKDFARWTWVTGGHHKLQVLRVEGGAKVQDRGQGQASGEEEGEVISPAKAARVSPRRTIKDVDSYEGNEQPLHL